MTNIIGPNTPEENRFKTISDFKDCLIRGGEIEFEWKGVEYGVFSTETYYYISRAREENETTSDTPDGLLDFMLSDDKLRDVITKVKVLNRSF